MPLYLDWGASSLRRRVFISALKWRIILRFRSWPRRVWRWIGTRWTWGALAAGGLTLINFGEYGFGRFVLALAVFAASSKVVHWNPPADFSGWATKAVKITGCVFVAVSFVFLAIVSLSKQGNDSWSHLPAFRDKFVNSHWPVAVLIPPHLHFPSVPSHWKRGYQAKRETTPQLPKNDLVLSVALINPSDPAIIVENQSYSVADEVRWELVMFRTSDQAFFSYVTQNIGYVKPRSKSAPYSMELNTLPHLPSDGRLTVGDNFMGTLSVDCPLCKGKHINRGVSFGAVADGSVKCLMDMANYLCLKTGPKKESSSSLNS